MKQIILFIAATIIISTIDYSYAWGPIGHRVVGEIATHYLSKKAAKEIKKLLEGDSLAEISTWPDFVRYNDEKFNYTIAWHYINIPPNTSFDPKKRNLSGDIVKGLNYFSERLKNKKLSQEQRALALKFLVHLVGDIHQPLHSGYKKDKGGNSFEITWFGKKSNLHKLWDSKLIRFQHLSYTEYANFLKNISKKELAKWKSLKFLDWVKESRAILAGVYKNTKGKKWEYAYNYKHIGTLNERLQMGGIRLANLLNEIL